MEQAQGSPFKLTVVFREQSKEQAVQQDEAGRPQTSPPPVLHPRHGARSSRGYRGVSGDKCRYEAHVWAQRKQARPWVLDLLLSALPLTGLDQPLRSY